MLFPSIFRFGVGAGAVALAGTLGAPPGRRIGARRALAALALAGALALALFLGPLVARSAGDGAAFAAAHQASVIVAFISWAAAAAGLVLGSA